MKRRMTLWRRAKAVIAAVIAIAALLFLTRTLHASWNDLTPLLLSGRTLTAVLALSVVYGVTFFIPFGAWYYTLRMNSPARVPFTAAAHVYCLANIAKYLPGSVMHFAGRQILGARLGWHHTAIARATVLEIGAMAGGICLVVVAIGFCPPGGQAIESALRALRLPADSWRPLALLLLAVGAAALMPASRFRVFDRLFGVSMTTALIVLLLYALYFAIYAAMAVFFVANLSAASPMPEPAQIAIAFLLAWLIGFAVPGAPSGIGLREAALTLLLTAMSDGSSAAALALGLGMRFVNTLGDAICAGLAYALSRMSTRCAKA